MNSIDYDYIIYFLAFLCLIIPARDLIVRKNKKGLHKISFAGWWFIVCAVLLTVVSIGKSRSNQNDEKYNHDYGAINGELKDKKNKVPRLSVGCQAEPFGNPNGNILDLSKVLGIELIVMIENEQLLVTTTVTDSTGIQLATLTKNEWTVNPNGKFDRNFDDKAIEVKDEYGKIVLQV
ncbi:MAG: hypothetical protein JO072_09225, partial [Parafilimonas sp.]|nr:hypothetical protein [Parafilimonas sp.]